MANSSRREEQAGPRNKLVFRELGILLALLFLMACLALFAPRFLDQENLFNVLRQFSFIAIIAIGETFVIVAAGIDLSVGAIAGLSGVVCCALLSGGFGVLPSVALGLLTGVACGLFNGSVAAFVKLPYFIVTLAMMSLARGFVYVITQGRPIANLKASFFELGQGTLGPVPIPVIVMFVLVLLGYLLLNRTSFGRRVAALGGNEQVALLTGLHVTRIKIFVFAISGFCSAVAGILLASRLNSGQPTLANGYELDAIAAVVIGGTSLFGGSGSILGTLIGAAVMGVMRNGLVLLNVSAYWQSVAIGMVILIACSLERAPDLFKLRPFMKWTNTNWARRAWIYGLLFVGLSFLIYSIQSAHQTIRQKVVAEKTIAVVPKLIHPYFEIARRGATSEAQRLGVHLLWQAPITSDPAYQAQIIEDLITKRVDAIAVAPVDDKVLMPFLAKARKAGIPVLTWDVDSSDKSDRIAYVGTDNYQAGKIAGEEARLLMADRPGNLEYAVMTGSLGALNLNQRMAGFDDGFERGEKRVRVALEASDDNADAALSQAESILKGHPNLSLIFCSTGTGTPQAAKAVKEAGLQSQITVVGFDALDDTLQAVRDGSVKFIVAQRPYLMGQLAVRYLDDYLNGRPVPETTDTGATVVMQRNIDSYQ
jgi:ribose/xylose/arabinose/galactoside ABC-type transport system permease subunit/ABC-type sugar transport system substrate-binding protein